MSCSISQSEVDSAPPGDPAASTPGATPGSAWAAWREHFERNSCRPLPSPPGGPELAALGGLSPAAQKTLAESLARFQRGETGEGRVASQIHRESFVGVDADYRIALMLLMREEARHAQVLGRWVNALGGKTVESTWSHTLFVRARRLWGVRAKLLVLLAAEAVGAAFYELLSTHLPAGGLRDSMAEIFRDEEHHVAFHCEFFRRQQEGTLTRLRFQALFRLVGGAAATVVAVDHRRTLEALGIGPAAALGHVRARLDLVERQVLAGQASGRGQPRSASAALAASTVNAVSAVNAATSEETVAPSGRSAPVELSRALLPGHVAVIMDGNGRWAEQRGHLRIEGHRRGVNAVREVVRASRELGVGALTLYAFSSLNWQRPRAEVEALMGLLERYLVDERQEIMDKGIRLCSIGDEARLPAFVRRPLDELRRASAGNREMTLCLALSYGGRESLVEASQKLARQVASGALLPEEIDAARFAGALSTAELPEVDLVIRTSGEQRLSNFLLWEAAQAELYFSPKLWPDFDRQDLWEALLAYQRRERRLGLTSDQLRPPPTAAAPAVAPAPALRSDGPRLRAGGLS